MRFTLCEKLTAMVVPGSFSFRNSNATLVAENEELKSLLKVKEESEKTGLKLNIQKLRL